MYDVYLLNWDIQTWNEALNSKNSGLEQRGSCKKKSIKISRILLHPSPLKFS